MHKVFLKYFQVKAVFFHPEIVSIEFLIKIFVQINVIFEKKVQFDLKLCLLSICPLILTMFISGLWSSDMYLESWWRYLPAYWY